MPVLRCTLTKSRAPSNVIAATNCITLLYLGILAAAAAQPAFAQQPVDPIKNPAPKNSYEIVFRFDGLPGEIADVVAFAYYEVDNRNCIPLDHSRALGGVRLPPGHTMDLVLNWQDTNTFTTTVHEDALADTDLFGLGECHWRMDGVTVSFRSPATRFSSGTGADKIRTSAPSTQYYLVKDFFEKPKHLDYVFGEKPDHYLQSLGPQFTLTATPRRLP